MNKRLDAFLRSRIGSFLVSKESGFALLKSGTRSLGGTYLGGCDVYQWKVSKSHIAWVIIGGVKDRDVACAIAWTRSGQSLKNSIKMWELGGVNDVPDTGLLTLLDNKLIGEDDPSGKRWISIEKPSILLQKKALDEYSKTEIYSKTKALLALSERKINPNITDDEIDKKERDSLVPFFSLWSRVGDYANLSDLELDDIFKDAFNVVFYSLEKYAIPFLRERMT